MFHPFGLWSQEHWQGTATALHQNLYYFMAWHVIHILLLMAYVAYCIIITIDFMVGSKNHVKPLCYTMLWSSVWDPTWPLLPLRKENIDSPCHLSFFRVSAEATEKSFSLCCSFHTLVSWKYPHLLNNHFVWHLKWRTVVSAQFISNYSLISCFVEIT